MEIKPIQQQNIQNQPQDILPQEPQKSGKKMIYIIAAAILLLAAGAGAYWYFTQKPDSELCNQVITPAKNLTTGACKEYSTPCKVPFGWQKVDSCPQSQDETAGWQTYRNEEYGFEVKYPTDWLYSETNNAVILMSSQEKVYQEYQKKIGTAFPTDQITIQIRSNSKNLAINDWVNSLGNSDGIISGISETQIGGQKGLQATASGMLKFKIVYVAKGSNIYSIGRSIDSKYIDTFNQILSTFKFTK